jgi:glycosyltransferase involved in cell wall biosynthesis
LSAPEISICIRAWRRETLADAIASVLSQGVEDLEVVVSDAKGDLGDIAQGFGDKRVRYHRAAPRLSGAAHIRSVMGRARGRYLGLLDDDDRYLPGFLAATAAPLRADPNVGVAFTNHLFDERGRQSVRSCHVAAGRHDRFLATLLREAPVALSAALMRRETWEDGERRQPLSDDLPGDAVMWLRAAEAGWAFYYVDAPLMIYRVHGDQMTTDAGAMRARDVRLWSTFRFDDPVCEALRRTRLAGALSSRGAHHLKHGDLAAATADLAAARQLAGAALGRRHRWLERLACSPLLARAAVRVWQLTRHRGQR